MKTAFAKKTGMLVAIVLAAAIVAFGLSFAHAPAASADEVAAPDGLVYFVDCGTNKPEGTDTSYVGRVLGSAQTGADANFDQEYKEGENKWGYTNLSSGGRYYYESNQPMHSVASGDGYTDHTIVYKFTIPTIGEYDVDVIGFDPWSGRSIKIAVEDSHESEIPIEDNVDVPGKGFAIKKFEVTTAEENELVTVSVSRASLEPKENPTLAAIVITEKGKPVPVYAETESNFLEAENCVYPGADAGSVKLGEAIASAEFNVVMSDGTTKTYRNGDEAVKTFEEKLSGNFAIGTKIQSTATINDGWFSDIVVEQEREIVADDARGELYYNVDCNGTDKKYDTPDVFGSKQTGENQHVDQEYTDGKTWGWQGTKSANYTESTYPAEESMWNDLVDFSYTFTGFEPDEGLVFEVSYYEPGNWGSRDVKITVGTETTTTHLDAGDKKTATLHAVADNTGKAVLSFAAAGSDLDQKPLVSLIKIYKNAFTPAPALGEVPAQVAYTDESITVPVAENAVVYLMGANSAFYGSITAESTTLTLNFKEYLPEGAYELTIAQAVPKCSAPSATKTVKFLNVVAEKTYNAAENNVLIVAKDYGSIHGATFKIQKEGGEPIDLEVDEDHNYAYTYTATENGTYTLTATENGISVSTTVVVDEIGTEPPAPTEYTVKFELNGAGATGKPADATVAENGKVTRPADPTREGYTFAGWYTAAEGGTEWNFGTDTVTGDKTLYAHWTENTTPGGETPGGETPGGETPGTDLEQPAEDDKGCGGCGSMVGGGIAIGMLALGAGALLVGKKRR